jgi:hypothetical protein
LKSEDRSKPSLRNDPVKLRNIIIYFQRVCYGDTHGSIFHPPAARVTIINLNGAAQHTCKCSGWLQHWRNFSVLPMPYRCPGLLCREKAEVGVLVQRDDDADTNWYIVPLCKLHSQLKGSLEISSFTPLISADVSETCGKSLALVLT